ncbi:MAG: PIN domain-containing protein [Methanoregula sp.]
MDANALMMPAQFKIDLFEEIRALVGGFEPVVLKEVVQELTGLTRAKGKDGAAARFGLALVEHCTIAETPAGTSNPVDERVIEYAEKHDCMVVTNDRRVRDELLDRGIGVISMRNQKKLEILRR